jgi:DNA polymerase type B, organellar and viral
MFRQREDGGPHRTNLTGDADECLEKMLFRYLENKYTKGPITNGWRLYGEYYTKLTLIDDNVNISGFKRQKSLTKKVFQSLYGYTNLSIPPQGFSIRSASNLHRMAQLLNIDIVIINDVNSEIWFSSCKTPLSEISKTVEWFSIDVSNDILYAYYSQPSLRLPSDLTHQRVLINGDFQNAFERVMQFPRQRCLPSPPGLSSEEFLQHSKMLQHEYRINDAIIVFRYEGNMSTHYNRPARHRARVNLSQTFIYLGEEPSSDTEIALSTPLVIYGDYLCVPTFEYIKILRQQMLNDRPYIHRDNRHFRPIERISNLERIVFNENAFCERRNNLSLKRKANYAKKANKRIKRICGESSEEEDDKTTTTTTQSINIEKYCQCGICTKEAPSNHNMSSHGQEQLTTITTGCYDLLLMLGIDTPTNRNIINTLCQWSIASFDIEAMTQPIATQTPLLNTYNTNRTHSYIGGPPQQATSVQRPIMIGHSDCFNSSVEVIEITDVIADDVDDDEVDDTNGEVYVYRLVERYWTDIVMPRYASVVKAKNNVAQPLLDYLKKYNEAHVAFCLQQNERLHEDILKTYHHTLPGQLESRIRKLINQYIIFSFYGSGYDMVMLESYLIPYLYEQSYNPKLDKKGERVTIIRLQNGICFRDVTKLLAPSTNLRSFGALFNLPVEKGHFPFSILTGPQSLKQPKLPKDVRTWQSDLSSNGSSITQADVNEAIAFFNRSGFTNVGQYLKHYLTLDVMILQQATDLWRQRLFTVIGLDFVDIDKYTISSLSNYAGNHKSATLCRPGWFFPNNSQIYSLLKRGMRG